MSKPEFIEREHPGQNWTISTERPLRSIAKIKQALIAFLGRYSEEEFSDFTFLNKIAKEFPGTEIAVEYLDPDFLIKIGEKEFGFKTSVELSDIFEEFLYSDQEIPSVGEASSELKSRVQETISSCEGLPINLADEDCGKKIEELFRKSHDVHHINLSTEVRGQVGIFLAIVKKLPINMSDFSLTLNVKKLTITVRNDKNGQSNIVPCNSVQGLKKKLLSALKEINDTQENTKKEWVINKSHPTEAIKGIQRELRAFFMEYLGEGIPNLRTLNTIAKEFPGTKISIELLEAEASNLFEIKVGSYVFHFDDPLELCNFFPNFLDSARETKKATLSLTSKTGFGCIHDHFGGYKLNGYERNRIASKLSDLIEDLPDGEILKIIKVGDNVFKISLGKKDVWLRENDLVNGNFNEIREMFITKSPEKQGEESLAIDLMGKSPEQKFVEFIEEQESSMYFNSSEYEYGLDYILDHLQEGIDKNGNSRKEVNLEDFTFVVSYNPEKDEFYVEITNKINQKNERFRVFNEDELCKGNFFYNQVDEAFEALGAFEEERVKIPLSETKQIGKALAGIWMAPYRIRSVLHNLDKISKVISPEHNPVIEVQAANLILHLSNGEYKEIPIKNIVAGQIEGLLSLLEDEGWARLPQPQNSFSPEEIARLKKKQNSEIEAVEAKLTGTKPVIMLFKEELTSYVWQDVLYSLEGIAELIPAERTASIEIIENPERTLPHKFEIKIGEKSVIVDQYELNAGRYKEKMNKLLFELQKAPQWQVLFNVMQDAKIKAIRKGVWEIKYKGEKKELPFAEIEHLFAESKTLEDLESVLKTLFEKEIEKSEFEKETEKNIRSSFETQRESEGEDAEGRVKFQIAFINGKNENPVIINLRVSKPWIDEPNLLARLNKITEENNLGTITAFISPENLGK